MPASACRRQPEQRQPSGLARPRRDRPAAPRHWNARDSFLPRHGLGNQEMQAALQGGTVRAALRVSQPDDPLEQEADRVAEAIVRMPDPAGEVARRACCPECAGDGRADEVQRQAAGGAPFSADELAQDEEEERQAAQAALQLRRLGAGPPGYGQRLATRLAAALPGGQPLDPEARAFAEPRFGRNFEAVRVHTGQDAAELCDDLSAAAFTLGRDVFFGAGRYDPAGTEGRRLLAHELAHTLQPGSEPAVAAGIWRDCQEFPHHADPDTYCQTQAEAQARPTHACPPDDGDFLYQDGPPSHRWRRIPGYGCAHYVAHRLNITNGPRWARCLGGFSVTIAQVTQGRTPHPLSAAQVGDVWSSGVHSGVIREVDAAHARAKVEQCGVFTNVGTYWFTNGQAFR